MKHLAKLLPSVCVLAITACGGSGGSSDATGTTVTGTDSTNGVEASAGTDAGQGGGAAAVLTGRFVDSAVSGLQYATASQSGVTDANGSFSYLAGEQVMFSIGDIDFPVTAGADIVTPVSYTHLTLPTKA